MKLWDFSLSLYPKPGVAEACLALQNQHGFDVNVFLCCLWLAQQRRSLAAQSTRELVAQSDAWRGELIAPLRQLRTKMKHWPDSDVLPSFTGQPGFTTLRDEIKAAELHGEKLQQLGLEELVSSAELAEDEQLRGFVESWRFLTSHYASTHASRISTDLSPGTGTSTELASPVQLLLTVAKHVDDGFHADLAGALKLAALLKETDLPT